MKLGYSDMHGRRRSVLIDRRRLALPFATTRNSGIGAHIG